MDKQKKNWITYGIHYDPEKFNKISENEVSTLNKPMTGGLWCSPVDSSCSWKRWCEGEYFRVESLKFGTKFNITPDAKILKIDSLCNYYQVKKTYGEFNNEYRRVFINFSKISKIYDAVYLTESGFHDTRWLDDLYDMGTYSWDCESMVILNNNIITDVELF